MQRSDDYTIRPYRDTDRDRIAEITVICFDGVSIDQNIERMFGPVDGIDWKQRKVEQVLEDLEVEAGGAFVATCAGEVIGYITTRLHRSIRVGGIPNLAVLPEHQQQGIGRRLIRRALDHFRSEGMRIARIETLEQNPVGQYFYPKMGFHEVARQIHYALLLGEPDHKN